ncbi:MAG: hypothetical protein HYW16_03325 [Candidatus Rokubacteria bacterium]|nr:hypothetical protein [Candidatus Rokubacteria bacterium]
MQSGEFWTERKVAWYRRALRRSDFAPKVLGAIAPLVEECETALDVGAGCGALAIPLARRLRRVTALEPAPAMAKAPRGATSPCGPTILSSAPTWGISSSATPPSAARLRPSP